MSKTNITIPFDEEKLSALDFSLGKENSSTQQRMDQALVELYEKSVPEPLREYLDSRSAPTAKPKRTAKSSAPKSQPAVTKSSFSPVTAAKEDDPYGG